MTTPSTDPNHDHVVVYVTEACGRQLLGGLADEQALLPVSRGEAPAILLVDPIVVARVMVPGPDGHARPVLNASLILDVGWFDSLYVVPSAITVANAQLTEIYRQFIETAKREHEVARARSAGIQLAARVTAEDIETARRVDALKRTH